MADSCRVVITNWWKQEHPMAANAGLLNEKYLQALVDDKGKNDTKARGALFEAMRKSIIQSESVYQSAYKRQTALLPRPIVEGPFITKGRMVIGLGCESVLETGITLHHTYGTPIIPGTALKGLASHYCDQVWGAKDDAQGFKRWREGAIGGEYHKTIFGTTDDSGHIIFHDAWVTPETLANSLQPDVMTPHHGDYYSGVGAPTDFDDPNPITFLSVVGMFHIAVSCDVSGEEGQNWAKLAFDLLAEALKEWGIGGKTNAGYGRLAPANSDNVSDQSSVEMTDSKTTPSVPGVQEPQNQPKPASKKPKYKKGDTVEVTKVLDPKEKRGASYFMADDGIGGMVAKGTAPSVEIGHKARLIVNGVMAEGYYVFGAIGSQEENRQGKKDKRLRR